MRELEAIYRKRKNQLLPLIFGFAAFFVIFRVVIPQWTDIQDVGNLLTDKNVTVEAKEETLRFLNSIPTEQVENNYTLVTTALPIQKDVILIFNELNDAAARASVKLGGFSVRVGGIYAADKDSKNAEKNIAGVPFLNILVSVTGQGNDLKLFADELYKSLPIVEILSVDITKSSAQYDVNFFFKPVALRPQNADSVALKPLTPIETKQLETITNWRTGAPSL